MGELIYGYPALYVNCSFFGNIVTHLLGYLQCFEQFRLHLLNRLGYLLGFGLDVLADKVEVNALH